MINLMWRKLQWRNLSPQLASGRRQTTAAFRTLIESFLSDSRPSVTLRGPLFRPYSANKRLQTTNMGCGSSKIDNLKPMMKDTAADELDEDYIEGVVCQSADLNDNEMKTFDLEDVGKVLLVKQDGKLNAIGAKCTHYGAMLHTGVLGKGRVRCPWHGACFNIATGDIEDFPGMDSLPCYQVRVEADGGVVVRARRKELESNKRVKVMVAAAGKVAEDKRHFVVIGGGPSGGTCVETLRQEGFKGKITMVCKENALPYDRVKVSKAMDVPLAKIELRTDEFYASHDITVLRPVSAVRLDTDAKVIHLSDNTQLNYDKVYIATGSKPLIPSSIANVTDYPNQIVTLRDHTDSTQILGLVGEGNDKEIVILGGSFIALEAAASLVGKVGKVTVVLRGEVPFSGSLGHEVGAAVLQLFKEKGVQFRCNSGITGVSGSPNLATVTLTDNSTLPAQLLLLGVGSTLNTEFLRESHVQVESRGALEVDDHLRTNVADVYAGGDIVRAPVYCDGGRKSVIGHYPLAQQHGHVAAVHMVKGATGKGLQVVPFFWTMLFGKGIRYAGHAGATPPTATLYHGDVAGLKYVAFYLHGDRVTAVSSCGQDPVVACYAELLAAGRQLHRADLEGGDMLKWTRTAAL